MILACGTIWFAEGSVYYTLDTLNDTFRGMTVVEAVVMLKIGYQGLTILSLIILLNRPY